MVDKRKKKRKRKEAKKKRKLYCAYVCLVRQIQNLLVNFIIPMNFPFKKSQCLGYFMVSEVLGSCKTDNNKVHSDAKQPVDCPPMFYSCFFLFYLLLFLFAWIKYLILYAHIYTIFYLSTYVYAVNDFLFSFYIFE